MAISTLEICCLLESKSSILFQIPAKLLLLGEAVCAATCVCMCAYLSVFVLLFVSVCIYLYRCASMCVCDRLCVFCEYLFVSKYSQALAFCGNWL